MASVFQEEIDEVLRNFDELEDPRSTINQKHSLTSVVVIAIMAILSGCAGPTAIARWAELKKDFLSNLLDLQNGIPSKDVFRRVLMSLKPDAFQVCFANWVATLHKIAADKSDSEQPLFAVDGKTLRRTHDLKKGLGALHSVSVWASESGLTLAQVATDDKSNEITAIPRVLALVDLKKSIVTIDAMGTQTAIAKQIVDGHGDYVLALKGNQGTLFEAATDYLQKQSEDDFKSCHARRLETTTTGHGRTEYRTYIHMPVPKNLKGAQRWAGLKSLGVAVLYCIRDGKETIEARYFVSSLSVKVKQFAHAVRSHWSIENSCHWCLDVTYREDECRIRDPHFRENFAWLNRFTLSLLRQHPGKGSVAMKRRSCGWSEEYMLEVLTGATS